MLDETLLLEPGLGPLPFAGTGIGVRVAVIDSGAHAEHPHIGRIMGGVAVASDGTVETGYGAWVDRLGHGTATTAAIQEKAPDAECFAVRVFRDSLRTTAAALLGAIDWCVEQEMDLVNLSLGTTNPVHAEAFAAAAERARQAGTILIAAREADGLPCFPGGLPGVLGVGLDWNCPRNRYRRRGRGAQRAFYASGYPRPIPGVRPYRNLYGVSFAVANMTGFVARACETEGGLRDAGRADRIAEALGRELAGQG